MKVTVDPRIAFFVLPDIDHDGAEMFTLIAKSRFPLGKACFNQGHRSPKLNFSDIPGSSKRNSSILEPSDLSPTKTYADLFFVDPKSKSPEEGGSKTWTASLEVDITDYSVSKQFDVYGPRLWMKSLLRGWRLTEPAIAKEVPLTFEHAFGGSWVGASMKWFPSNPTGRGFELTDGSVKHQSVPGHQFEEARQRIDHPDQVESIQGITPVDRWWAPRLQHISDVEVGTPSCQFSPLYHNCAPSWLQFELDKLPGATISLTNIGPETTLRFILPTETVWFLIGDIAIAGVADTYAINLNEHAVDITWRASIVQMPLPGEIDCVFEKSS